MQPDYNKTAKVELRGRVVVKTNNKILNSNHIVWDLSNNHLNVKGVYALNECENWQMGRNIVLDYQLNQVVSVEATDDCQEGKEQCYAGLF